MKPGLPWSIKGIPPEAREAAKEAAQREGITLGAWMTRMIAQGANVPGAPSVEGENAEFASEAEDGTPASVEETVLAAAEETMQADGADDGAEQDEMPDPDVTEALIAIRHSLHGIGERLDRVEQVQVAALETLDHAISAEQESYAHVQEPYVPDAPDVADLQAASDRPTNPATEASEAAVYHYHGDITPTQGRSYYGGEAYTADYQPQVQEFHEAAAQADTESAHRAETSAEAPPYQWQPPTQPTQPAEPAREEPAGQEPASAPLLATGTTYDDPDDAAQTSNITPQLRTPDYPPAAAPQSSFGGGAVAAFLIVIGLAGLAFVYLAYIRGNDDFQISDLVDDIKAQFSIAFPSADDEEPGAEIETTPSQASSEDASEEQATASEAREQTAAATDAETAASPPAETTDSATTNADQAPDAELTDDEAAPVAADATADTDADADPAVNEAPAEEIGDPAATAAAAIDELHAQAEQGDVVAQRELAAAYMAGIEVDRDYLIAAQWYEKAADQGDADAQYALAKQYQLGQGIDQDMQRAITLFLAAAEQDMVAAQNRLGEIYATGQGTAHDYQQAVKWFGKAAAAGHRNAQYNLGIIHAEGIGVERNPIEASVWLGLAAAQNDTEAATELEALQQTMSADEIEQARSLTESWKVQLAGGPEEKLSAAQVAAAANAAPKAAPVVAEKPTASAGATEDKPADVAQATGQKESQTAASTATDTENSPVASAEIQPASQDTTAAETSTQAATTTEDTATEAAKTEDAATVAAETEDIVAETAPAQAPQPAAEKPIVAAAVSPSQAEPVIASETPAAAVTESPTTLARVADTEPAAGQPTAGPAANPLQTPAKATSHVAHVQKLLQELGYNPGPVDGLRGNATREAIIAFQSQYGLDATGRLTLDLIDELEAAVAQ